MKRVNHGTSVATTGKVIACGLLGIAALVASPAGAQTFPSRPVRIIVPFTPGGSTDISTRVLAAEMPAFLGQPVIVENKPGNAGGIGADFVAKSEPDGYTLLTSGVGPTVLLNATGQQTSYDALRDLVFVIHQAVGEGVLVARNNFPASNLRDVIAYAKANPGKVSFGNSGHNGVAHLHNELLCSMAGIEGLAIPYKGDAPRLQDVMGGQVDLGMISVAGAAAAIKAGSIKAIAVAPAKRSVTLPNVPTVDQAGVSGYDATLFQLIAAPIRTPAPIVDKLNVAMNSALALPSLKAKYQDLGMIPTGGTSKEATDFARRETETLKKVLDMIEAKTKARK
jgi:tripartite-type tricarboxylate transporter receptor subunit TctC